MTKTLMMMSKVIGSCEVDLMRMFAILSLKVTFGGGFATLSSKVALVENLLRVQ